MRELDLFIPLTGGTALVEAAAGTGKTYSIAALFLRLVVEKELPVDSILVVTFTEAATAELRERIRERLGKGLEAFSGSEPSDEFLAEMVRRSPDPRKAVNLLALALASFDGAAIHTIHGFCSRVLQEHSFECGALFETEMLTDQSPLLREIAEDAWRRKLYPADPLFIAYVLRNGWSVDRLYALLHQIISRFSLSVIPDAHPRDHETAKERCLLDFCRLKDEWRSARERVVELLAASAPSLNQTSYRKASIPGWKDDIDCFLAGDDPLDVPEKLAKFTEPLLAAATRKGMITPEDPFFGLCETFLESALELEDVFKNNLLALQADLALRARSELGRRKELRNLRSYDDLLLLLYEAVKGRSGEMLKERIRKRFSGGLIDEFQDTDPVQYAIFSEIFSGSCAPLIFIGDPKQAIYSFRGADLHAYLSASRGRGADESYTLLRNWRSTPELLGAFNVLFSGELPFVLPEIEYRPVSSGRYGTGEGLFPGEPPFVLRYYGNGGDKPLAKGKGERLVAADVAVEIAHLIRSGAEGQAVIAGRPLAAGDIAVLVRKNHQGLLVQEALASIGIPSVIHGTESLFRTREVNELHRLLVALLDPANGERVRAALATDMLGWSAGTLAAIGPDAPEWSALLARFRRYHLEWLRHGFMVMAMELLATEGVRPRLLAYCDGERRLTDLLHAVEVLHHAELERELGVEGLTAWLAGNIAEPPDVDEFQLRLETDESSVQLVTIHRSKGLEYPVVFCPFAWEGERKSVVPVFHRGDALVMDLGSDGIDESLNRAREEQFAEDLRLLYVAVTRARFRCYLYWGRFAGSESSALAYLIHRPSPGSGTPLEDTRSYMAAMDVTGEMARLQRLEELSCGSITVVTDAAASPGNHCLESPEAVPLEAAVFNGEIERNWRVTSFTGLTSSRQHEAELPDRDAFTTSAGSAGPALESVPSGIFAFPRGAQAGTCLHAIFERVDFADFKPECLTVLIEDQLLHHGFSTDWTGTVADMVVNVVNAPLQQEGDPVSLRRLEPGSWRPELEFMLPLGSAGAAQLAGIFRGHGRGDRFPELLEELDFREVKGMLRGFVDLVFRIDDRYYLIDWKSNHLGNRCSDYDDRMLAEVMTREFYTLQYHIYTVALHRYLALRQPGYDYDRHFGGVFYLFLRGISEDSGDTGIFRCRPERTLIDALADLLSPLRGVSHG